MRWSWGLIVGASSLSTSCIGDISVGELDTSTSAVDAQSPSDAGPCIPTRCQGRVRECGDCEDNDDDGLSDLNDPDCLSLCDDSESVFANASPCGAGECFFDNNCGGGNDAQCQLLTPNGCDCNGCCMLPDVGTAVSLGSQDAAGELSCNSSLLDDPDACQPCDIDDTCFNPCDECELCVGLLSLPDSCRVDDCAIPVCDEGRTPCGGCAGACPDDELCVTGCCAPMR